MPSRSLHKWAERAAAGRSGCGRQRSTRSGAGGGCGFGTLGSLRDQSQLGPHQARRAPLRVRAARMQDAGRPLAPWLAHRGKRWADHRTRSRQGQQAAHLDGRACWAAPAVALGDHAPASATRLPLHYLVISRSDTYSQREQRAGLRVIDAWSVGGLAGGHIAAAQARSHAALGGSPDGPPGCGGEAGISAGTGGRFCARPGRCSCAQMKPCENRAAIPKRLQEERPSIPRGGSGRGVDGDRTPRNPGGAGSKAGWREGVWSGWAGPVNGYIHEGPAWRSIRGSGCAPESRRKQRGARPTGNGGRPPTGRHTRAAHGERPESPRAGFGWRAPECRVSRTQLGRPSICRGAVSGDEQAAHDGGTQGRHI